MQKVFPQYLSAPFRVLWFEPDEMVIFLACFTLAMIYGWAFWVSVVVGPWGYTKIKKRYPRGFLKHALYFAGIVSLKGYPEFFEERFIE